MGAPGMNFHANVFGRMGYADVVAEIGALFQAGRKAEAAEAVPDELISDVTVVGSRDQVRERLRTWSAAGVTMLVVGCRSAAEIRSVADAVLDQPLSSR
jgi:alkanesulfonate monooxygenase SsuD/methylene tetrahydromethanopterin reductase-like flavin-dependent oxidoreductase (luciferase family)